jgi:Na+-driven multidrug efflux pump
MYGPAIASLFEYGAMLALALWVLCKTPTYKPYLSKLTDWNINWPAIGSIIQFSIPVIIDKSALSFSYVWLSKMLATLGAESIATFDIIKNLERSAIMPAAAFAQVITFLISNHIGAKNSAAARITIIKVLLLTSMLVSTALIILGCAAPFFVFIYTALFCDTLKLT